MSHPCPNCGYCPTCGRRNVAPYQPWGTWPWPARPMPLGPIWTTYGGAPPAVSTITYTNTNANGNYALA